MSKAKVRDDAITSDQTAWEGVPMTDAAAIPKCVRAVSNVPAIKIQKGAIRNAQFENCIFELVSENDTPKMRWGMKRILVKCLWFGKKPPTTWMHVGIIGEFDIIQNYTGDVVEGFGR